MLTATIIGNVGADAATQTKDGRTFTTFRVAHNDSWTDANGQQHNNTIWVDCIMNERPKVCDFIKAGTLIAVIGSVSLRVYSSAKDRCMKAGMQINVRQVELLGGRADDVPSRLYDSNGVQHDVKKFYGTDVANTELLSISGKRFITDKNCWAFPVNEDVTQNTANND